MDRSRDPNKKKQLQTNSILLLVVWVLGFFIGIGDVVRYILRAIISIPLATYNVILNAFDKARTTSTSWLKQKFAKTQKGKLPREKPKKKISVFLAPINRIKKIYTDSQKKLEIFIKKVADYRSARLERAFRRLEKRKQLAKFTKPSLSMPSLSFPAFRLPSVHLPALTLPSFPQAAGRRKIPASHIELTKSFIMGVAVAIVFVFAPYTTHQWLAALPNPQLLSRRDLQVTTKIFDRNGALLYEIYADQNRTPLPLPEIPAFVKDATVAIEDQDFYRHVGISPKGILRAARETFLNDHVQGGSTITQQLIKSALLSPEVKLTRKIKEIILAFWAERLYTKNQILEMYLNQVPYGGTAWGVEAASQTYFGKSAKSLNLAEAALLAGLPAAPTEYSPFGTHPEKALDRQKEVLRRMTEDRYITREQAEEAIKTPLKFAQPKIAIRAPHFVMYVKNILEQRYGERLVEHGGLQITTSLDINIQEKAEEILKNHIDALASLRVGNGAALVTDPKTGEILAMVGSKNYFDMEADGNVNVTTSLRQPGSSIKVINYAAALENGFTPASILDDSPVIYQSAGSPPYAPVNYDGKFHGPTPLRYALANSYNIPAVKILAKIGVATMIHKGKLMGITSWEDESRYGLSLTLGGGDVTMLDMAKVFGSLANAGKRVDLMPILKVTDYTGRVFEHNKPKNGIEAIKPETAWIMSSILSDNTARISAFGPNSSLVVAGKTVSVKTGTTDNKRDNWTIGYTPSYVTTVWVGNNNNAPMDPYLTSGITGAAPIWHDIMSELLKTKRDEIPLKPENVVAIPCYFGRSEYFIDGTQPASGRCAPLPTPTPTGSPTPAP